MDSTVTTLEQVFLLACIHLTGQNVSVYKGMRAQIQGALGLPELAYFSQ